MIPWAIPRRMPLLLATQRNESGGTWNAHPLKGRSRSHRGRERRLTTKPFSMPRPPNPASQRATAEFFGLRPDRFCRLLQRYGIDYQDKAGVAQMLKRSTSMSPTTRRTVEEVLKVTTPDAATKTPVTALEQLEVMATLPPPKAGSVEDAETFLETLKKSLVIAEETSAQLRELGQFEDSRRWLALHSQLSKQFPPLARQLADLKERLKLTISTADAQSTFNAFLMRFRSHIERMPSSLSGKVNPADQEHSFIELTRWVDGVFKVMNQHPVVTP